MSFVARDGEDDGRNASRRAVVLDRNGRAHRVAYTRDERDSISDSTVLRFDL
jgi:hypothetical protein